MLCLALWMATLLYRPDVVAGVQQIYHDTMAHNYEQAMVVYAEPNHTIFVGGSGEDIAIPKKFLKDAIAVIHTHPDPRYPEPSPTDMRFAHEYHLFLYVLSRDQLWVATENGTKFRMEFPAYLKGVD